ncbi:MAG: hypothetical protein R3Y67_02900 [Eubacteriales bacterium]
MKKITENIVYVILVLAGATFCMYFFANIPTKPLTDLITSKVSYEEIIDGYDLNFVGKIGADDVPVLTSDDLTSFEIRDSYDFVVETQTVIPLGYYELKNSDWSQIARRTSSGRAYGVINIPEQTENPLFFYNFLYAGYYLVELDDGSYIAAFMNQDYANSKTLPIAYKDRMSSNLEDDIIRLANENMDISIDDINLDYILIMQVDESNFVADLLDLGIRIVATFILAVSLILISTKIERKIKDKGNENLRVRE